jgi:hypothetical protein
LAVLSKSSLERLAYSPTSAESLFCRQYPSFQGVLRYDRDSGAHQFGYFPS